jgi:uncharacterized protein with ParB-like and HNH nuclease domain
LSRFTIPIYQRPYSWTDAQIDDLYRDLNDAINANAQDYFLGTLVTTRNNEEGRLAIIDGQQRLVGMLGAKHGSNGNANQGLPSDIRGQL